MSRRNNDNDKQYLTTVVFPNRENVTSQQLANLLSVGGMLLHGLTKPWQDPGDTPKSDSMPAEARIAAEHTFMNVCARLDTMLAEDERWNFASLLNAEKDFEALKQKNSDYLDGKRREVESRAALAQELGSPHARYKPLLLKLTDGNWVAYLGSLNDPDKAISGIGRHPTEALQNFDNTFEGKPHTPEILAWLKERARAIERNEPLKPYPTNEQATVDSSRDNETSQPPVSGDAGSANSGIACETGSVNPGKDAEGEAPPAAPARPSRPARKRRTRRKA